MDSEDYRLKAALMYRYKVHGYPPEDEYGLLEISKQVRAEALPFFRANIAISSSVSATVGPLRTSDISWVQNVEAFEQLDGSGHVFLTAIGPKQCAAIRTFTIAVQSWPKSIPRSRQRVLDELNLESYGLRAEAVKVESQDCPYLDNSLRRIAQLTRVPSAPS